MSVSLVLTVLGNDHPGVVETLSEIILSHQGEWVESHFANPAGLFAGIVRVDVPAGQVEALQTALGGEALNDMQITFKRGDDKSNPSQGKSFQLELLGQDRPGIVHQVSKALTDLQVNVDELHADTLEASMSGEQLFKALIHIRLPPQVTLDDVREALESIANELMVDIDFDTQQNSSSMTGNL